MEGSGKISDRDRARLVKFLDDLHRLLERLLTRRPSLLSPLTLSLLRAAWQELESEKRFEQAKKALEEGNFDHRLVEHGLRGAQLDLKVSVYELMDKEVEADDNKVLQFLKRRRKLMARALKAGNVILGSLAEFIPGIGAIQEFKDAAEAALDHQAPVRQRIVSFFKRGRCKEIERAEEPPELILS